MEQGNKRTPQRFVGREAVVTTQCLNGWLVVFYSPFMLMSDFMAWHVVETQFLHPTWSLFRCLANECHLAIILYIDRINQLINLLQVSTQDIFIYGHVFFSEFTRQLCQKQNLLQSLIRACTLRCLFPFVHSQGDFIP